MEKPILMGAVAYDPRVVPIWEGMREYFREVGGADSGISSLSDIRGKRLALGSADSAQAAFLPIHYLQEVGVEPTRECTLLRFDVDVGKHGDTGTSELDVLRALSDVRADAGALAETTWRAQVAKGKVDPSRIRPIWTSPGYCHCNFTVPG